MTEALVDTELRYAHFNACRTSPSDAAETQLDIDRFVIADRSRPTVAYYNRAVLRSSPALAADGLTKLGSSNAFEVWPNELDANFTTELQADGFRLAHSPCYLAAVPNPAELWPPSVVRLAAAQADEFLDLLKHEGVTLSEETRDRKRSFYCTEEFQVFVASDKDGVSCAWGAMFIAGRFAYLGNDFTRPEYRGRGYQTALITARLKQASDLELEAVFSDVEFESQSHQNYERAGFRIVTINTLWERTAEQPVRSA